MRKFILFLSLFLTSKESLAGVSEDQFVLKSSELTYHVNFVLKSVEGTSTAAKGKGQCVRESCEFLIAVPTKTFISGDSSRDSHMLEVTKAAEEPLITVKIIVRKQDLNDRLKVNPEVRFAGATHKYEGVDFEIKKLSTGYHVKGRLPLLLSHFSIERPKLLTVPIEDQVPLDIETQWVTP